MGIHEGDEDEHDLPETAEEAQRDNPHVDNASAPLLEAPSLSKSWAIADAHVPIFTGGKVSPLQVRGEHHQQDNDMHYDHQNHDAENTSPHCLLLPVGGDIAIADARRGIKLGSVREGMTTKASLAASRKSYHEGLEDDDDDEGIDADSITAYALSSNHKLLITCSHNHILRQYALTTTNARNRNTENNTTSATATTDTQPMPLDPSSTNSTGNSNIALELQKTWGRSGHALPVTGMEFHRSNVFVATGSVDGTVRIWDVRGGHVTHLFKPLAGGSGGGSGRLRVTALRWLPCKKQLVIAIGRDDGSIAIHDLRDATLQRVVVLRDHMSAITCMDWWWGDDSGNNGENRRGDTAYPPVFLSAGRDAVMNLWTIQEASSGSVGSEKKKKKDKFKESAPILSYRRVHTLPIYEQIEGMVILPSSNHGHGSGNFSDLVVATAGSKGVVRLWNSSKKEDDGMSPLSLLAEQSSALAFGEARGGYLGMNIAETPLEGGDNADNSSPPNQLIVADAEHCLSFLSLFGESTTDLLRLDRTIVGHNDDVLDLKMIPSPRGATASHIVVATNSPQVRVFGLDNFSCDVLDHHTGTVLCVDVSPCGRYIATCGKDKKMCIWHTQSRKCVATAIGHTEAVGATALSRKAGRYDVRGKAATNGGGAFAVTVSIDRTLKRWNLPGSLDLDACAESGAPLSLGAFVSARAHEKDINIVSVAPNDSMIASGSQDKTVKLWRSTDLAPVATLKGHRRGVWDCQFSPFDRVIATASGDRTIRLWSLSDFSCVRTFQGHVASVLRVRFLNGGLQLVSSGADGLIKLFTIRTNECETTMDGHADKVWALDVAPSGKSMVSGGADSQINVWQDTTKEVEDAKHAEREEAILLDQQLSNHLRHKQFKKALDIALNLDKPRLTLKVLTSIIDGDLKEKRDGTTTLKEYARTWSMERVAQVLRYCREWNTRARNSDIAMLVVRSIVSIFPANKLVAADGIPEVLAGIAPYAERHFDRLDRLFTDSYLLDFALFSMGSLDVEEGDFSIWEANSKLVLPPQHVDGKIQKGGKTIVGAKGNHLNNDGAEDVSTVGDSDSSDDEDDNAEPKSVENDFAIKESSSASSESGNVSSSSDSDSAGS